MVALLWASWSEQWELQEKVSFNGYTKEIWVNAGVTSLDIQEDLYSAWVRWTDFEPQYDAAMRFTGLDPIPGGQTGATFFLINGWKLIYDPRIVAVSGILYSDDYDTAYYFADGSPVYPATVSALSLTASGVEAVVDVDAIATAVAAKFAEPSMTTAGIASAIGTVDVDAVEIADEVQGRFIFGTDGRVAADIDGSASEKTLKRAVTAAIPSPTSAQTIWEAAPKHLLKEFKSKDYTRTLSTISKKIEQLASMIPESGEPIDLEPVMAAIQSGDSNAQERADEIIRQIQSIEYPDLSGEVDSVNSSISQLRSDITDLGFDIIGVRNAVKAIPKPDLSSLATSAEIKALSSVAKKLKNYDDSEMRDIISEMLKDISSQGDRADKKLDLVLDNQLSLL